MNNHPRLNEKALEAAGEHIHGTLCANYEDDGCLCVREEFESAARAAVSAYLAVAHPVVTTGEELDKLPSGTIFTEHGEVFAFQIVSNGEPGPEGREIVCVGIEESYKPEDLDFPLTVIGLPVVV